MHDTLADLKDPQARSPGLQQVNVSNSMGAPQSVMLEQLQWFAKEVLAEFNGGAPIA